MIFNRLADIHCELLIATVDFTRDNSVAAPTRPERPQCRDARGYDVPTPAEVVRPQFAQNLRAYPDASLF